MNGLRLSVIIPCLNEGRLLPGFLEQLQAVRSAGHEVIVVDGGSTDDSRMLVAPLVDRVLHSEPGRAVQMNAGASVSTGDVLWFLHADTLLPEACHEMLQTVFRDPSNCWGRFDIKLDGSRSLYRIIERTMNLRSRLTGIATGDQGMFMRRSAYLAAGGFPEIPLMEDVAMSRNLRKQGKPAVLKAALTTSSRRWEEFGIVRTILLMWALRLAYYFGVSPERLSNRYPKCGSPTPGN